MMVDVLRIRNPTLRDDVHGHGRASEYEGNWERMRFLRYPRNSRIQAKRQGMEEERQKRQDEGGYRIQEILR